MKTHSGEKQLKCDICDKDFTNERNLLKHVCSRYNETFLSGNDFKKHTRFCNSEERQSIKGGNTVMSVSSNQMIFGLQSTIFSLVLITLLSVEGKLIQMETVSMIVSLPHWKTQR